MVRDPTAEFAVPGLTVIRRLGSGGMATVWLAHDSARGEQVALKVIDPRQADSTEFRQRFAREAQIAARLNHPNIVHVDRYGEDARGTPYLTMTWCEGGSLGDLIERRGPLPVQQALAIVRQIATALVTAHRAGVIHRDIKPDNILFKGDTALLSDFGIVKLVRANSRLTATDVVPGTVTHMAPEQVQGARVDARVDLYALGVVLHQCLCGELPIRAESVVAMMIAVHEQPPDRLPAPLHGLQPLLDALLAKNPDRRIGSAFGLVRVIEAIEDNLAGGATIQQCMDGIDPLSHRAADPNVPVIVDDSDVESRRAAWEAASSAHNVRVPLDDAHADLAANHRSAVVVEVAYPRPSLLLPRVAFAVLFLIALGTAIWAAREVRDADRPAPMRLTPAPPIATPATTTPPATPPTTAPDGPLPADPGPPAIEPAADVVASPAPSTLPSTLATAPTAPAALPAMLIVDTTPADARVTLPDIDPAYDAGMELPAGPLRIRASAPGHADVERVITLVPGPNVVALALEPAAPAPAAAASAPGARFRDPLQGGGHGPWLVTVPAGAFRMGDLDGQGERNEQPVRTVTIGSVFAIGVHEVTFAEFDAWIAASGRVAPSDQGWGRGEQPVVNVSWQDARAYAAWLSARTGHHYRLPSEAEWEYAARAGSQHAYWWGDAIDPSRANYNAVGATAEAADGDRYRARALPVGQFAANPFGLHDAHGNVWEWVEDCYADDYRGAPLDGSPVHAAPCRKRVVRGGSWYGHAPHLRAADRFGFADSVRNYGVGFRLVREL